MTDDAPLTIKGEDVEGAFRASYIAGWLAGATVEFRRMAEGARLYHACHPPEGRALLRSALAALGVDRLLDPQSEAATTMQDACEAWEYFRLELERLGGLDDGHTSEPGSRASPIDGAA